MALQLECASNVGIRLPIVVELSILVDKSRRKSEIKLHPELDELALTRPFELLLDASTAPLWLEFFLARVQVHPPWPRLVLSPLGVDLGLQWP